MFCPNCKTEYRSGFTQCSDCGATLLDTLPENRRDDVPELLWSGNSPRLYQEFRAALEAARVPFMDQAGPHFLYSSLRPPLEIWISKRDHDAALKVRRTISGEGDDELAGEERFSELGPQAGRVSNLYQDQTRPALPRGILAKLASKGGAESENPVEVRDEDEDYGNTIAAGSNLLGGYFSSDAPEAFSGEFHPEDATSQVYSGDLEMVENLKACLRENGIPSVIDEQGTAGSAALRVLPEHAARAKEIIREVIEATPPE
jgi:hypothetical protein